MENKDNIRLVGKELVHNLLIPFGLEKGLLIPTNSTNEDLIDVSFSVYYIWDYVFTSNFRSLGVKDCDSAKELHNKFEEFIEDNVKGKYSYSAYCYRCYNKSTNRITFQIHLYPSC